MNETSPTNLTPQESCFQHLVALKFALAGDLESHEALETLALRMTEIQWDNPAFIKFSEAMRTGLPTLTTEQYAGLKPSLYALLHALSERLAQKNEDENIQRERLRNLHEKIKIETHNQIQIRKFVTALVDTHLAMRDRLEVLGADTSEIQVPKLEL